MSRGTQYRLDHPDPRDDYHAHSVWQRGQDTPQTAPVLETASRATDAHR